MPKVKPLIPSTVRGHMFEVFVRILLEQNGWLVQEKGESEKFKRSSAFWIQLKGRGTWHQIDAPCVFEKQIPFIYPLRLISEMKFLKGEVQKDHIREFLGVVKDVSENYFVDKDHSSDQERFTEVGTYFSANGFQKEAINLGFAHGIRTVSYRTNKHVADIKDIIDELVTQGFPERTRIKGKRKLARFKEELLGFLAGRDQEFVDFTSPTGIDDDIRSLLLAARDSLNGIKASFIGTTSTGILLHFLGKDKFPEELFAETDTQACQVFYDEPTYAGIPMWFEFSNDEARPKRRFYFDVPPGLETAIRKDGDVIGEKQKHFANVAIYKKVSGLMRLLTLQIDLDWVDRIRRRAMG